jgi:two-component system heavy metal sensor histidine kinase CusS
VPSNRERLSAIVDNLLLVARAEGADEQVSRSLISGRPAVEKIVSYYETLAEEKGVTLSCHGDAQVSADPMLFNRALTNLIENALKFTPPGGKIEIAVLGEGKATEIRVSDTGIGIPAEHLPHVFDRFYRVDPSRPSGGSGLGLALVKSILDLHGGSVAIESEANRGTTVAVLFPMETPIP